MASDVHRGMNSSSTDGQKKNSFKYFKCWEGLGMLEKKEQWQSKERDGALA